ncbi:MAG: Imm17 family immunity protein [Flavobacteriales bacterium]
MINLAALILIFITGVILMTAALFNWGVFFNNNKAGFFAERWGNKGARVAYFFLGVLIVGMGIYAYYNGFLEPEE